MRFSDGVKKYHEDKKRSILDSVLNSAQELSSDKEDREGIIMTTKETRTGAAMVKTSKSGIIAAALAILMIGGAFAFHASRKTNDSMQLKTSPGAQPGVSAVVDDDSSDPDDSSETPDPVVPLPDDGTYPTTSPAAVMAPDDKGTIEEGFEGYDIEVKYLVEDLWKGLDDYAQHSYGIVIDVTAKDGYKLPWADEEPKRFSHFGDLWIDNGHTGYFDLMKARSVVSYGYKTQNEEGNDVLRYLIIAEVDDDLKIDKDTKLTFDVNVVYWGEGENFKTEGKFTASVTFDPARTLDLALIIPYQMGDDADTETDAAESESEME